MPFKIFSNWLINSFDKQKRHHNSHRVFNNSLEEPILSTFVLFFLSPQRSYTTKATYRAHLCQSLHPQPIPTARATYIWCARRLCSSLPRCTKLWLPPVGIAAALPHHRGCGGCHSGRQPPASHPRCRLTWLRHPIPRALLACYAVGVFGYANEINEIIFDPFTQSSSLYLIEIQMSLPAYLFIILLTRKKKHNTSVTFFSQFWLKTSETSTTGFTLSVTDRDCATIVLQRQAH